MNEFLPRLMMIESFIASVIYLLGGDYNRALYWASAGTITLCVLRMN